MIILTVLTICLTSLLITLLLWCGLCDDSNGEVFSEIHPATGQIDGKNNTVVMTETIKFDENSGQLSYSLTPKQIDGYSTTSKQTAAQANVDEVTESDFVGFNK